MLDQLSIPVPPSQFDALVAWYTTALAPLNHKIQHTYPTTVGLGPNPSSARFWITATPNATSGGIHIAFRAEDHGTVDRFHEAAVRAGGVCNGKPGLRALYGEGYYAAFVLDPLGNNVEVVDRPGSAE